jgi:hypothetical protein
VYLLLKSLEVHSETLSKVKANFTIQKCDVCIILRKQIKLLKNSYTENKQRKYVRKRYLFENEENN